jgi:SAM-dependent methyltransferase
LASLAAIPAGATVLDVGTGGGAVLFPAAERTGEGGLAVGVDIDHEWAKETGQHRRARGLDQVAIAQMDAAHLGFGSDTFDVVLCGFIGWDYCFDFARMRFTRPDTRLASIRRVLKAGGQAGFSAWTHQDDMAWLAAQIRQHLPAYTAAREAERPDALLVYSRETPAGFEQILRAGGLQRIEIVEETEDLVSTDEGAWWRQMRYSGWHGHFERIAAWDESRFRALKEQVFAGLQSHKQADGIHFEKSIFFAFGTK